MDHDWNDEHCPRCSRFFENCSCGFFASDRKAADLDWIEKMKEIAGHWLRNRKDNKIYGKTSV